MKMKPRYYFIGVVGGVAQNPLCEVVLVWGKGSKKAVMSPE